MFVRGAIHVAIRLWFAGLLRYQNHSEPVRDAGNQALAVQPEDRIAGSGPTGMHSVLAKSGRNTVNACKTPYPRYPRSSSQATIRSAASSALALVVSITISAARGSS